jgi:hypothetical protein
MQGEVAKMLHISAKLVSRRERNVETPTEAKSAEISGLLNLTNTANSNSPTAV